MPTGEFANTNCIAHGDYRLDNIIFDNQSLKVKAVLDWELCTIGSPIADIAYNSLTYYFPTYHMGLGMIDAGFHGIPTVEEVKQIYSIEMGLGVS